METNLTEIKKTTENDLIHTTPVFDAPAQRRRGRLKKGEKVVASGCKTMTMAEAYQSVEGMKHKIANKYRVFCNSSVSYDDIIGAANIGLAWAYRDWDSKTAKFTTFSHNRIERQIDLYLCEMLPKYKNNVDAKNWLRRKNDESYKQLVDRKVTKDDEFNTLHALDGDKVFTKEHYNLYTQKTANRLFNDGQHLVISTASAFQGGDNQNFDIFDTATTEDLEDSHLDINDLDNIQREIAELIMDGYKISEIAKKFGVSKSKLISLAGVSAL